MFLHAVQPLFHVVPSHDMSYMASPERSCVNDRYGANMKHGYGEQSLDLIPLEKVIMQLGHASPCMVCERLCGREYAAQQDYNATFRLLWEVLSCHY